MRDETRRGLSDLELLTAIGACLVLGALIVWPVLFRPSLRNRGLSKEAICRSNLRGIGQSMTIYANDNNGEFPRDGVDWVEDKARPEYHGVSWVGAMGSSAELKISEPVSASRTPRRSHPSRSMFLLIIGGQSTPQQFVCPVSGEKADDLRNYGPDAADGKQSAAQPDFPRFDFSGYDRLSYGVRMPFGVPKERYTAEGMDNRDPLMADKGPAYTSGGPGLAGTNTTRDAQVPIDLFGEILKRTDNDLKAGGNSRWRILNSRNHRGEGQIVMYVDGHADFVRTPLAGVDDDNLYTIASDSSWRGRAVGFVPNAEQLIRPVVDTDVFIVP